MITVFPETCPLMEAKKRIYQGVRKKSHTPHPPLCLNFQTLGIPHHFMIWSLRKPSANYFPLGYCSHEHFLSLGHITKDLHQG